MTEADLARVESELGVSLPAHYREFMLNYPADFLAASFGPEGEPGEPADFLLPYEPETLIRVNREARQHLSLQHFSGSLIPWPEHYFVIGRDSGGDHWFIKLKAESGLSGLVWRYYHEKEMSRVAALSLERYADNLRKLFEKFCRGEW